MAKSIRLACAALFLLAGCSVKHLPDAVTQQPATYRYHTSVDGIDVGIDPYLEEQRIVEYFGTNLLSDGILPVYLVIRNNTETTLMFDPRDVSCSSAMDNSEVSDNTAVQGQPLQNKRGTEYEAAETVAVGTVAGGEYVSAQAIKQTRSFTAPQAVGGLAITVGGALLAWAVDYEIQKNEVSNKSIARKQISEKTVFSGETHSGFVYFRDKDQARLGNVEKLAVRMVEKSTGKLITVIVTIKEGADTRK